MCIDLLATNRHKKSSVFNFSAITSNTCNFYIGISAKQSTTNCLCDF